MGKGPLVHYKVCILLRYVLHKLDTFIDQALTLQERRALWHWEALVSKYQG